MTEIPRRTHIENQVRTLLDVTDADIAYKIVATTFTEPAGLSEEKHINWQRRAERGKRQILGAALGERAARITVSRLAEHLETHDSLVIDVPEDPSVQSASLQRFAGSMTHWFTDSMAKLLQENDATTQALLQASSAQYPAYRDAVRAWQKLVRSKGKEPAFYGKLPERRDNNDAVLGPYQENMSRVVPDQFLILGLGYTEHGHHTVVQPAEYVRQYIPQSTAFASTVLEISRPIMAPFVTSDSTYSGIDLRTTYSNWEHEPTPQNARTFLDLSHRPAVKNALEILTGSLPGAGEDGRASTPGHCHADMRITKEEAFPVTPRSLLERLGENELAKTEHLSIITLVDAVGFQVASETLYKHWPTYLTQ